MATISQLKFTYYDAPARGDLSRLLFLFGGVTFEDKRIQMSELEPLKPTLPLGQIPVLEVDGEMFSQSMAIARYAANLAGLYPQDAVAALRADMASESLVDLFNTYVQLRWRTPDAAVQTEKFKSFAAEDVVKTFDMLERMTVGPFFLGDNASIADIHIFDVVHNALEVSLPQFSLAAYPKVEAIVARVKANAHVAKYIAK